MLAKLTIAIIGVLPAVAFADDLDHAIRERVSAGLSIASAAQTLVNDNARKASADFSRGWTSQQLSSLNPFLRSVKIDPTTGVITVNYTEQAKGIRVTLTPSAGGAGLVAGRIPSEDISWHCAVSNTVDSKYVPDNCHL
jgi:type IV pilus assembly protein PilA